MALTGLFILPVAAVHTGAVEQGVGTNLTHLLDMELLRVLVVLAVVGQSVLFGPGTNAHFRQQIPATYECAGFGYCS
jgi:hypothetical protein